MSGSKNCIVCGISINPNAGWSACLAHRNTPTMGTPEMLPAPFGSRGDCLTCGQMPDNHSMMLHEFRPAPGSENGPSKYSGNKEVFLETVWTAFDQRHACFSGDCPHHDQVDCNEALMKAAAEMVAEYFEKESGTGSETSPDAGASRDADAEALRAPIRWMTNWINESDCDCESSHICGKPERASECAKAQQVWERLFSMPKVRNLLAKPAEASEAEQIPHPVAEAEQSPQPLERFAREVRSAVDSDGGTGLSARRIVDSIKKSLSALAQAPTRNAGEAQGE